jgi:hypothetical protein
MISSTSPFLERNLHYRPGHAGGETTSPKLRMERIRELCFLCLFQWLNQNAADRF